LGRAGANASGRKFPQFQQNDIFSLADAFRKLDVDDKGYIDEATAIKATQASERQPYDVVRQALKEVELDSSRRVELEDYVGVRCAVLDPRLRRKLAEHVASTQRTSLLFSFMPTVV
jgi:plastin-1